MIAYSEIQIIPYPGQNEPKELVIPESSNSVNLEKEVVLESSPKIQVKQERKVVSQPSGKLQSVNIGIKETLNPTRVNALDDEEELPQRNEEFTEEELQKFWKDYAYALKKDGRDGLFTTLTGSEMIVGSDRTITLKIKNHQVNELESEKIKLLRHLRYNLKNTNLNLVYKIEKTEAKSVIDSKATFDKLAEENGSLKKLRKMFNLDIEF